MRVLIIDDSKTMRSIQRAVVEQLEPAAIEEACDGQDGLSKAAAFAPDLILVDSSMPRIDGIEFVERFRSTDAVTPVIMVSTQCDRDAVVRAIRAGVSNYIIKPFTPDLLMQRIQETMARGRAGSPA